MLLDFPKGVPKYFEMRLALGGVDAFEFGVDLAGELLSELNPAMQDVAVLGVKVQVAARQNY